MEPYEIIRRPLQTEKSVADRDVHNCYYFEVADNVNKIQIKKAVEKLFNVKVLKVRTLLKKGKIRKTRFGLVPGHMWKKAIVTLAEGNAIDLGF